MAENNRELIEQGRREVAEDRRIAGLMIQDENRQAMTHRADVTERLCDALDNATTDITDTNDNRTPRERAQDASWKAFPFDTPGRTNLITGHLQGAFEAGFLARDAEETS